MKQKSSKPVAVWIFIGIAMLIIQVILGGITRLTGSGLSITEWDVITGTLPPLNHQDWTVAFEKYKTTPQYRLLNFDFNLSDFKFIFFWEWFHRFWGRIIAIAFAVPFIIFLIQRRFRPDMVKPLIILFLLGALQGAVGWIMVASGLTGDAIYVKPTKLALHFVLATILIVYAFWFGLQLVVKRENGIDNKPLKNFTWVIIVLLFIQFVFGALMAGHRAAPAAPTWPDINGTTFPPSIFNNSHGWLSIIDDRIVIHFIHRSLAYLITILIVIWTIRALRSKTSDIFRKARLLPLFFVLLQVALGVFTVLTSINIRPAKWNLFEWNAQIHQLVAIFLLLSLTLAAFLLRGKSYNKSLSIDPAVN